MHLSRSLVITSGSHPPLRFKTYYRKVMGVNKKRQPTFMQHCHISMKCHYFFPGISYFFPGISNLLALLPFPHRRPRPTSPPPVLSDTGGDRMGGTRHPVHRVIYEHLFTALSWVHPPRNFLVILEWGLNHRLLSPSSLVPSVLDISRTLLHFCLWMWFVISFITLSRSTLESFFCTAETEEMLV